MKCKKGDYVGGYHHDIYHEGEVQMVSQGVIFVKSIYTGKLINIYIKNVTKINDENYEPER
jgi:hypothetical protein